MVPDGVAGFGGEDRLTRQGIEDPIALTRASAPGRMDRRFAAADADAIGEIDAPERAAEGRAAARRALDEAEADLLRALLAPDADGDGALDAGEVRAVVLRPDDEATRGAATGCRQNPLALRHALRYAGRKEGSAAMSAELSPIDKAKYAAARRSVDFVENGMKLGLGTGSTAAWMVRCLAERVKAEGLKLTCVATSRRTAEQAKDLGLKVVAMDDVKWLDLTIDGADEFDPNLNLIKGGGAALLQEKIVATASDRMIVIADAAKEVAQLGAFPLPVEVVPFGWQTTKALIEETLHSLDVLNREVTLRLHRGKPLKTDEGHYILDLNLKRIGNPRQLALVLNQIPGVVENGLFIDICDIVVIGHGDGRVTVRDINSGRVEDSSIDLAQTENIFADLGD